KTSDTREAPSSSSKKKSVPHSEQPIEEVPIPDDVNISDSEDTDTAYLPKIKTRPDWLKSIPEEDRLETLEPDWVIPPNDLPEPENNWANAFIEKSKLSKADLEGPAYKGNRLVPDVGKPLPLGGPPGQVTIQPQFFFNKDMEYLVSCNQERRNALSISMLKAAYYPDFGLEEFEFYITRHSAPSDRGVVRSQWKSYALSLWYCLNIQVIPKYHSEDGNPARANIEQALGSYKDGDIDGDTLFQQSQVHNRMLILDQHLCRNHESSSKRFNASVNSDINFFLSMSNTQDGEGSQDDDQRLRLADDLKKAQDHIQ
ncbi:hypothetical protein Tco_1159875, partial [Tanacetum coccineum]